MSEVNQPSSEEAVSNADTAPTAFELVGGEERVRALVDRFYDLMDLEPEFAQAFARCIRRRSTIRATRPSGSCAAGWAGRITTSAASGIRACGRGICRSPLRRASAINGCAAWPG